MSDMIDSTKELILGGLLHFKRVREAYISMMEGKHMTMIDSDVQNSPYATVERAIQLYIRTDIDTTVTVIMRRLLDDMKRIPPGQKEYKNQLLFLLVRLDRAQDYTEQVCEKTLQEAHRFAVLRWGSAELRKMGSVHHMQKVLSQISTSLGKANKPGRLVMYDPIASMEELLQHRDKIPTGITFLDTITGGGITLGEHGGCLGAPGGGKTTLATMMACNMAIQGYNAMFLQFEQSLKSNSDITSRIYSYLTGLPVTEFRNKAASEISETARAALMKCRKISERIRVASFIDDDIDRTVDAIIDSIEHSCEDGFTPHLVIIDWLGAVVSDFMAVASGTDKSYPQIAEQVQDSLNKWGKSKNISFFYLHQLSNEAANRESGSKPSKHDAYFFKGFSQKLEYCIQLGTRSMTEDNKQAMWIVAGKVRDGMPDKSLVILLNGLYARFEATEEGDFIVNKKNQLVAKASMYRVAGDDEDSRLPPRSVDSFSDNYK